MSEQGIAFLPEHQAPNSPLGGKPGYNPPPEEKKVIQLVDSIYSKSKKYRKRYDSKWNDFYKMFRGKQWKEVRPSYRHSEVINIVFQTIQSMVPILTDSRPKLEFLPTQPSQFELSDILTKVAENDWIHNNWLMTLTEMLYDSHIYGTGFAYVGYDDKANQGLGNILFESADPFYVFPDPNARDINEKRSKHFVYAEPVDLSELKKQYPEKAQFFSSDVIDFAQGDKADINQVMFKSPTDSKLIIEGASSFDSVQKNQALKITLYSKDDDFEEEEKQELKEDGTPDLNPDGSPKTSFVQKLKYPNGRKIVVAGGVLCEDGPLEFDDGNFPYVRLVNYLLPREFWGMGDVDQLEGPQKTFNKIASFALDVMTLMGNPIWIVDDTSGIDTDNLFNKPGLIVEKNQGSEVRREAGVGLQPFVMELFDKYKRIMDGISGESDLSRGVESQSVTAASAIEDLQQAQQTRLRLKTRHIDSFLQQFGKMYLSRSFQYYSVPRIVRVSGDENASEFFYFHVEKLDQPDGTTKNVATVTTHDGQQRQMEITGDFDVRVSTGSSLPFAKEQKTNVSMNLFKLGVIDDEELLKNLDYPNYEAVLERVKEKKQQAMAQQMQMQQAQMQAQAQAKAQGQGGPQPLPPPGQ